MARKKTSKSPKYKVTGKKTSAGEVYHITPQERVVLNAKNEPITIGSTVHEAWTTNANPGSYDKKAPGMRRVRQTAYQAGATKAGNFSVNVTIVGELKESEGNEFDEPIDTAITYTMDRDDFFDFLTSNNSSLDFANDLGSSDYHVWSDVSEIAFEVYG
jgi:hypothetical protein